MPTEGLPNTGKNVHHFNHTAPLSAQIQHTAALQATAERLPGHCTTQQQPRTTKTVAAFACVQELNGILSMMYSCQLASSIV
jgi:hypothetical protein